MMRQRGSRRNWAAFVAAGLLTAAALGLNAPPASAQSVKENEMVDLLTEVEKEIAQGQHVPLKDRHVAGERLAASLHMRVRITAMTPAAPVNINWRYSGEGLGGDVVSGSLGEAVALGQWTELMPLIGIIKGASYRFFLTVTATPSPPKKAPRNPSPVPGVPPTDVEFEFEFSRQGKLLKTFGVKGPDGATAGLVIPGNLIANNTADNKPEVLDALGSLLDYATRRAERLEALPWAQGPTPQRISLLTDLGGYGKGTGYGIRYTDPAVVDMELRALRQLGVNSLRGIASFVLEKMKKGEGYSDFNHALMVPAMGMPVLPAPEGRATTPAPVVPDHLLEKVQMGGDTIDLGDPLLLGPAEVPAAAPPPERKVASEIGCPYGSAVPENTRVGVENTVARLRALPAGQVWGLTDDEIGSVIEATLEGKSHMALCDRCTTAYREWLQKQGLKPYDFGQKEWTAIRPLDLGNHNPAAPKPNLNDPLVALNAYYTRAFVNYSTANLFTPLRAAFDKANAQKKAALAAGQLQSMEAKQPWLYSFALRGNTFLMGGHSLDFFEFYRHADNAFVYETSNRDPRIWGWDSYLCDVGRMVSAEQNIKFGIYVKPHRGAPLQRALSSISRGASMIYWYTYGPDYSKGDSFSTSSSVLDTTSKAAHLIGRVESSLENAQWMRPAEVAIIQPFSLMAWRNNTAATASWEDNKWTYSALQHAHIPVDPIDEVMVVKNDISRYKVIYLPSPNLRRDAAAKLAAWVQAGGTLVTNAAGLSRDEANQPLSTLAPVLGLAKRADVEMWFGIAAYGATSIQNLPDTSATIAPVPAGAVVTASKLFATAPLKLAMGREVLQPSANAEVLARYADGGVASIRHPYGKGSVYVNGFFPGLEYSAPLRANEFDMDKSLSADTRSFIAAPALAAGVRPVVDASAAVVEGVLLKHPTSGARSVTLMNWGYRQSAGAGRRIIKLENLKVAIRGAGPVTEVRSAWLDTVLPMETQGDIVTVTLPSIDEGDVLVLK